MRRGKWTVGPETVRMLEMGHPWVIADRYTRKWPLGKAGDLIELSDEKGGFVGTALLEPGERVVARVLAREEMKLDRTWLAERVEHAVRLRKNHAVLEETDAYRLVNGEGDGLPGLIIDRYDNYVVLQLYSLSWKPYLKALCSVIVDLLAPVGIYEKSRPQETRNIGGGVDGDYRSVLLHGKEAPDLLPVRENGLEFLVRLGKGLDTGLFMDQRRHRRELMARTSGKRVLNLFSYTGAFSVAAVKGGAASVTSVDASSRYMDWARTNFRANSLDTDRSRFIVGDCFNVLRQMADNRSLFDIIILDPPSFSTIGGNKFTTRGGTSHLVASALPLLADGGLFICSSNHQKYDVSDYLKELRKGALLAGCSLQIIYLGGQPEDFPYPVTFPEGRYLKFAMGVKGDFRF